MSKNDKTFCSIYIADMPYVEDPSQSKERPVVFISIPFKNKNKILKVTSQKHSELEQYRIKDIDTAGLDPDKISYVDVEHCYIIDDKDFTSNKEIGHLGFEDSALLMELTRDLGTFSDVKTIDLTRKVNEEKHHHTFKRLSDNEVLFDSKVMTIEEFEKCTADLLIKMMPAKELTQEDLDNWEWDEEENIEEDIEKHETLNPLLWTEDKELKPEVKEKILAIVKDFTDSLEKDGIKFNLKDIKLVGSNCSYNYNKDSDLDVHLVMDTDSLECPDDLYPLLYSAYRSIWNKNHDVDFYGIPVEIFVETDDTVQMNDENNYLEEAAQQIAVKSNGIYSVLHDKWIKEPVKEDIPEVDMEEFNKLFKQWEDRYKEIIGEETMETKQVKESVDEYGLFAYKINPQTGRIIEVMNDGNPIEVGSKDYLNKKKREYLDSWNVNKQGNVFKFVTRFLGTNSN